MSDPGQSPFRIASPDPIEPGGRPIQETDPTAPPLDRIDRMVESSEIIVFMKGTPVQPMCGFSANTVAVMDALQVDYETFDVLSDESIRSAAKEYSRWPTFPQVFVRGEFIGGHDIVVEMLHSGELARMVGEGSS